MGAILRPTGILRPRKSNCGFHESKLAKNAKQLFDLRDRWVLITGGSIGLGRQMAEGLAEMGADVVLCARKKERCEEAARDLAKLGVRTVACACDVKNADSVQKLVDSTLAQLPH